MGAQPLTPRIIFHLPTTKAWKECIEQWHLWARIGGNCGSLFMCMETKNWFLVNPCTWAVLSVTHRTRRAPQIEYQQSKSDDCLCHPPWENCVQWIHRGPVHGWTYATGAHCIKSCGDHILLFASSWTRKICRDNYPDFKGFGGHSTDHPWSSNSNSFQHSALNSGHLWQRLLGNF